MVADANSYLIWDRYPDILQGGGYWIMEAWDAGKVTGAIELICERSSPGPDWQTVASRIGRILPWEFAGFEDPGVNEAAGLPRPPLPGQPNAGG